MHFGGYFSVIWKAVTLSILWTKNFLTLYCVITWNENHALMVIHYCMESQSYSITQLLKPWITRSKLPFPLVLIACRLTRLTQTLLTLTLYVLPQSVRVSGVILYVFLWDANERLATEIMMDKARTVTDTKTLWGEDSDKRNLCSASICLKNSHFRVQSYLYLQFLHFLSGQ